MVWQFTGRQLTPNFSPISWLSPRMVMTPWYDHEIPMTEAAELGTRKVIADHSTVGIVVTTDGSISDIPREDYLEPEERVIRCQYWE